MRLRIFVKGEREASIDVFAENGLDGAVVAAVLDGQEIWCRDSDTAER